MFVLCFKELLYQSVVLLLQVLELGVGEVVVVFSDFLDLLVSRENLKGKGFCPSFLGLKLFPYQSDLILIILPIPWIENLTANLCFDLSYPRISVTALTPAEWAGLLLTILQSLHLLLQLTVLWLYFCQEGLIRFWVFIQAFLIVKLPFQIWYQVSLLLNQDLLFSGGCCFKWDVLVSSFVVISRAIHPF